MNKKELIVVVLMMGFFWLSGCASVSYTSYRKDLKLTSKPQGAEILIIEGNPPIGYEAIGLLSITQSMEYGSWFLPSRASAREKLTKNNIEKIIKKAQTIGTDMCCELKHTETDGLQKREYPSSSSSSDGKVTVTASYIQNTPVLYLSTEARALIKKEKE